MTGKKPCGNCGRDMTGMKDAARRGFCCRECYRKGQLIENPSKQTVRKRHQREYPYRGATRICEGCGKRRPCQRHHEDISNPSKRPKDMCMECHVKRDLKLGKWGIGKPRAS